MAHKHENGGKKMAALRITGVDLDNKGNPKAIMGDIAGDSEAVMATAKLLQETLGEERFFVRQADEESSSSQTWGGVGKGKMDASRGGRTKRVLVNGKWMDISLN